jgi:hypothetical protein
MFCRCAQAMTRLSDEMVMMNGDVPQHASGLSGVLRGIIAAPINLVGWPSMTEFLVRCAYRSSRFLYPAELGQRSGAADVQDGPLGGGQPIGTDQSQLNKSQTLVRIAEPNGVLGHRRQHRGSEIPVPGLLGAVQFEPEHSTRVVVGAGVKRHKAGRMRRAARMNC